MRAGALLLILFALSLPLAVHAAEARLRCTADTNLSSYETERDLNYGASPRLRLKGIQMLALFRFDIAPVAGWKIERATLYLRYAGNERKLRTLGISTVSAPWQEGTGNGEQKPGESCFNWRAYGMARWAGPDTDFTDVSFTAGHTLASYADLKDMGDGWIAVPVEPRLVQALIAGVSYGLAVTDEKGQTAANNDIYSREQSGSEPYLVVEGAPGPTQAPQPVRDVQLSPDSHQADFNSGSLQLTLTAPSDAFAYAVRCALEGSDTAQAVPRFAIPYAAPGQKQTIRLTGLKPMTREVVDIVPISETGVRGAAVQAIAASSPAKPEPSPLPRPPARVSRGVEPPLYSARLRVWAYLDVEKTDPVSGNLLEEVGPVKYAGPPAGDYRRANAVWDGRAIHLYAARNEFVGFQLLIEAAQARLNKISVQAPDRFQSEGHGHSWKPRIDLFRDWYVQDGDWFPEVCVPLAGTFDIPAADNAVPGQRNQSVYVDLLVPRDAAPGLYRSALLISAEGVPPVRVPVEITVNALTLPDTLSFDISLNTYGTVGHLFDIDDRTPAYRALEREYHRMAHLHRATLAILGYSHSGNVSTNYAPPLEGSGAQLHVSDWTAWDTQFGPYFDGSAFADLPRHGVPITHFYLPFHEAWPVDIRGHYHYQSTTDAYPAMIVEHALKAPPIEQAFDRDYEAGFTAVARQFSEHFRAKGWTRTQFQFYQNDKHYYKDPKMGGRGTSWWLLDEPNYRDDWLALAYFDRLFRAGVQAVPGISLICREDVSRPQWQRDYLDGLVDLMVVSEELYTKGPLLREMQERLGVRYWNYGTANAVRRSNTEAEAWAVRAWLAGADGIVPWQAVGSDTNYIHADDTALLLPGKRFGITGPVASLRLKALRRAQQDVEYLVLLAAARHWDRSQVMAALRGIFRPEAAFAQENAEDAGRYHFRALRAADFEDLRRAVADDLTPLSHHRGHRGTQRNKPSPPGFRKQL